MLTSEKVVNIFLWLILFSVILAYWAGGAGLMVTIFSFLVANGISVPMAATCIFTCFIQLECIYHVSKIRMFVWLEKKAGTKR